MSRKMGLALGTTPSFVGSLRGGDPKGRSTFEEPWGIVGSTGDYQ